MIDATSTPLVTVELVSACVWVGSMVCLAVGSDAARKLLDGPAQVRFFRAAGRRYAIVGTASLLVAIGAGLWLAWRCIDAPDDLGASRAVRQGRRIATALRGTMAVTTAAVVVLVAQVISR